MDDSAELQQMLDMSVETYRRMKAVDRETRPEREELVLLRQIVELLHEIRDRLPEKVVR